MTVGRLPREPEGVEVREDGGAQQTGFGSRKVESRCQIFGSPQAIMAMDLMMLLLLMMMMMMMQITLSTVMKSDWDYDRCHFMSQDDED